GPPGRDPELVPAGAAGRWCRLLRRVRRLLPRRPAPGRLPVAGGAPPAGPGDGRCRAGRGQAGARVGHGHAVGLPAVPWLGRRRLAVLLLGGGATRGGWPPAGWAGGRE